MQNKPVLVVGSIALDDVRTPFGERKNSLGGSAFYFALAAAHFTDVALVAVAGRDYPASARQLLRTRGVNIDGLETADGKTFRWGGHYHQDINERDTLYTELNVFADFRPRIPADYCQIPYLFLGNIQPALQLDILSQMNHPKFVTLDTMELWIKSTVKDLRRVISKTDLLLINDSELRLITGEYNLRKGLKRVHQMGPQYVIIKQGEHGAYLSSRKSLFYAPAYPVEQPTDPTGAGDSFAGGLLGYLAANDTRSFRNLKKALLYGSIMGSFLVEHFSADGLLHLTKRQIDDRYRYLRKLVSL